MRRSTCVAGSWTAPEGLAGCARRQTAPDRPERRRKKKEGMRGAYFELNSSKNPEKKTSKDGLTRLLYAAAHFLQTVLQAEGEAAAFRCRGVNESVFYYRINK